MEKNSLYARWTQTVHQALHPQHLQKVQAQYHLQHLNLHVPSESWVEKNTKIITNTTIEHSQESILTFAAFQKALDMLLEIDARYYFQQGNTYCAQHRICCV